MTTDNTTTPTIGSVWTEQELFQHFLTMTLKDYDVVGNVVKEIRAGSLLREPGDGGLWSFGHELAESQLNNGGNELCLELIIDELEDYLLSLRRLCDEFILLKDERLILPPEPEKAANRAVWEDWSRSLRDAEEFPKFRPVATEATVSGGAA